MSDEYGALFSGTGVDVFSERASLKPTPQGLEMSYLCSQHPGHGSTPLSVTVLFEWYEVYLISKGHPPETLCHPGCDVSGKVSRVEAHRALEDALIAGLLKEDYLCEVIERGAAIQPLELKKSRKLLDKTENSIALAISELREERSHAALTKLSELLEIIKKRDTSEG